MAIRFIVDHTNLGFSTLIFTRFETFLDEAQKMINCIAHVNFRAHQVSTVSNSSKNFINGHTYYCTAFVDRF